MRLAPIGLVLLALIEAGCATGTVSQPPASAVPPSVPADRARASLALGQSLMARGETAAATIPLREALRLDPNLLEARSSLGLALYALGDVDGAADELRSLLGQHPDAIQARLTLATALMAKQDWPAAQRELHEIVRREPHNVQAHYSLGIVCYARGDLDGAIDAYQQVLARSPELHDARYNLALVLKLAHRDTEASQAFLVAARAGHPRAQFFMGTAYAEGLGVERDLVQAIAWWMRASEQGVVQAEDSLAELRQVALGRSRRTPTERQAVQDAFRDYREALWREYPDLRRSGDDTVGAALLREGRVREAVPVLLREAYALSEPSERLLETVYAQGVEGKWPPYDAQILEFFQSAAGEGQLRPRIALARFYAGGLGVTKNMDHAIALLRATPHEDAQRVLQELSAATEGGPTPVRP
jgi:TPR repeat protein